MVQVSSAQQAIRRLLHTVTLRPPKLPDKVGMAFYRQASSWSLDPEGCPCDLDFVEYLQTHAVQNAAIFHFGTGAHHTVGLGNQKLAAPNQVLAVTASAPEHQAYVNLVLKDLSLGKTYKVLFADIYQLTQEVLPNFDLITLFHLCEFYRPQESAALWHDDRSLLTLCLNQLNPNGILLFYAGSVAFAQAQIILQEFEAAGQIAPVGQFKSLLLYRAGEASN
jgi:hypothetical protein